MGKQEYLSAGRFAALVGTTKETLFHYDEIGLFVPKRRGTNGYRYYAMDQIETFDVGIEYIVAPLGVKAFKL